MASKDKTPGIGEAAAGCDGMAGSEAADAAGAPVASDAVTPDAGQASCGQPTEKLDVPACAGAVGASTASDADAACADAAALRPPEGAPARPAAPADARVIPGLNIESTERPATRRRPSGRIAAAAIVCALAIGCAVVTAVPDALFKTVADDPVAPSAAQEASDSAFDQVKDDFSEEDGEIGESDESEEASSGGADAADESDEAEGNAEEAGAGVDAAAAPSASSASSGASLSQGGSSASSGASSPHDSDVASGGSSSSSASSSESSVQEPVPVPEPATITVSVYIDSVRAASEGWPACLASTSVTLAQGATVYDALAATGVTIGGSSSYVRSINGLAEFALGKQSGWKYSVNGVFPNYGCGSYVLSGGESIRWVYVTDASQA